MGGRAGDPGCGAWMAKAELLGVGRKTAGQLGSGAGWPASSQSPQLPQSHLQGGVTSWRIEGCVQKEGLVTVVTTLCCPKSSAHHPRLLGGVFYYLNCLGNVETILFPRF